MKKRVMSLVVLSALFLLSSNMLTIKADTMNEKMYQLVLQSSVHFEDCKTVLSQEGVVIQDELPEIGLLIIFSDKDPSLQTITTNVWKQKISYIARSGTRRYISIT